MLMPRTSLGGRRLICVVGWWDRLPGRLGDAVGAAAAVEVLALAAGVGQGAVGGGHLVVAAFAGALQDLERAVDLSAAVGVGTAVLFHDRAYLLVKRA